MVVKQAIQTVTSLLAVNNIPPPPFATPPKVQPVEQVMNNPGSDIASLRLLTTALVRGAIFGQEELARCSLSGRKSTEMLSLKSNIKTLIKSRVPNKTPVEFEYIRTLRRQSLSKSCQTLRTGAK